MYGPIDRKVSGNVTRLTERDRRMADGRYPRRMDEPPRRLPMARRADWELLRAAAMADRMTARFLDQHQLSTSVGELSEDYRRASDRPWMVEHLWYLIGTGDLTVSSTLQEAKRLLSERRCARIRLVRARG